jgi:hypothetical protein
MSNVTHPSHYNSGNIEVVEAIEDWGLCFHLGNTVKYVARAGKKDPTKEIEDLEKGKWYLERRIEILLAEREDREKVRPNDMNARTPDHTCVAGVGSMACARIQCDKSKSPFAGVACDCECHS